MSAYAGQIAQGSKKVDDGSEWNDTGARLRDTIPPPPFNHFHDGTPIVDPLYMPEWEATKRDMDAIQAAELKSWTELHGCGGCNIA